MAVHFMFAASKQFECVPVEGDSIALGQLKDEIFNLKFRKALEKRSVKERFDFRVFDAESKEEILGARTRVRRHSRVVVKRLPAYVVSEAEKQQQAVHCTRVQETTSPAARPIDDGFGDDVFSTPTVSNANSGTNKAVRVTPKQTVTLETNVVRSTALIPQTVKLETIVVRSTAPIPRDLQCSLCHEIMRDSVLIPCCCTSFCRACISAALVVHQKCPSCASSKCKTSSDVLPNRSLNASVASFLKANGTVLTSSQAISNTSSSLSAKSGLSSEHQRSESTNITAQQPHNLTTSCVAVNPATKRKSAPLSISLARAKRTKPLIISS